MRHSRNATAVRRESDGTPRRPPACQGHHILRRADRAALTPRAGVGGGAPRHGQSLSHCHLWGSGPPCRSTLRRRASPALSDSAPQRRRCFQAPPPLSPSQPGLPTGSWGKGSWGKAVLGESATKRVGVGEGPCGAGLPIPRALPAPSWVKVMSFFVSNLRQWVRRQAQSYTEPPTGISPVSVESTPHQTFRYLLIKATKGVTDCRIFLFLALID